MIDKDKRTEEQLLAEVRKMPASNRTIIAVISKLHIGWQKAKKLLDKK